METCSCSNHHLCSLLFEHTFMQPHDKRRCGETEITRTQQNPESKCAGVWCRQKHQPPATTPLLYLPVLGTWPEAWWHLSTRTWTRAAVASGARGSQQIGPVHRLADAPHLTTIPPPLCFDESRQLFLENRQLLITSPSISLSFRVDLFICSWEIYHHNRICAPLTFTLEKKHLPSSEPASSLSVTACTTNIKPSSNWQTAMKHSQVLIFKTILVFSQQLIRILINYALRKDFIKIIITTHLALFTSPGLGGHMTSVEILWTVPRLDTPQPLSLIW